MSPGLVRLLIALLIVIASATATSGATYTASSDNPQAFTAAADFGLDVAMDDPGANLRGTRSTSATAASTDGVPITSVQIQRAAAGSGSWTTICTDGSSPYACSLDTTTLTDGLYDFRAVATNANGYSRISAIVGDRRIDNTGPSITQTDPGAWFRGTLTLSTTTLNDGGGSGVAGVTYQYKTSLLGTWTTACTANTAPFECQFATGSLGNGVNYDFRATATDVAGNTTTSATLTNRKPDNVAPTGLILDPGLTLTGIVSLVTTGLDLHSGLAAVTIQSAPTGTGTWSTACVVTNLISLTCDWNTAPLTDGFHDLRGVVSDVAGNTYTTPVVAGRRVDNTAPLTTLTPPAATLSGTVALSATADDGAGSGVANVKFQRSPAGAGSWTDMCTDNAAAYTCSWNTTAVGDGNYDLRTVATDNVGKVGYSSVVANRRTENYVPTAAAVETADSSGTHDGIVETGDRIILTYSEPMAPGSIVAGWDGTGSQNIYVRINHHNQGDRALFYNSTNTTQIPLASGAGVMFDEDYVPSSDAYWTATLTQSADGETLTATLGSITFGSVHGTAPPAATTIWTPATGARDLANKACTNTTRAETGPADVEF